MLKIQKHLENVINLFVTSYLCYCNALFADISKISLSCLQVFQSSATRILSGTQNNIIFHWSLHSNTGLWLLLELISPIMGIAPSYMTDFVNCLCLLYLQHLSVNAFFLLGNVMIFFLLCLSRTPIGGIGKGPLSADCHLGLVGPRVYKEQTWPVSSSTWLTPRPLEHMLMPHTSRHTPHYWSTDFHIFYAK